MSPTTFATLPENDQWHTFATMQRHGGGFCAALAVAWFKADAANRRRIETAFSHLLADFGPESRYFHL